MPLKMYYRSFSIWHIFYYPIWRMFSGISLMCIFCITLWLIVVYTFYLWVSLNYGCCLHLFIYGFTLCIYLYFPLQILLIRRLNISVDWFLIYILVVIRNMLMPVLDCLLSKILVFSLILHGNLFVFIMLFWIVLNEALYIQPYWLTSQDEDFIIFLITEPI